MGSNNYYAKGQWNAYCDLCGKPGKSSSMRKTWDGFYVCAFHKEERNPQDLIRGIKDDQSVPWSRPEATWQFVSIDSVLLTEGGDKITLESGGYLLLG